MAGDTVITIIGNLTADPELRWTQSGAAVADSRWPPPPEPTTVTPVSGATATPSSCAAPCGATPLENVAESLRRYARHRSGSPHPALV